MKSKTNTRRTAPSTLPRDARAEAIVEFVFNDEEEALSNEGFTLSHQRDMPALQEYLEQMQELDAGPAVVRWH